MDNITAMTTKNGYAISSHPQEQQVLKLIDSASQKSSAAAIGSGVPKEKNHRPLMNIGLIFESDLCC